MKQIKVGGIMMTNQNYYFVKPYDEDLARPPHESLGQILNETYLQPFNWKGRTTRKSYWISFLINAISACLVTGIANYALNTHINLGLKWIDLVVSALVLIWIFLAGLGQRIRRLHDVNYSGYWYWAAIVPYGALFVNFYLMIQPSVQRPVKWGNYLFYNSNSPSNNYYDQVYNPEMDRSNVPVPTIGQILKEHFFDCFKWNARSTRTSYWVGSAVNVVISIIGFIVYYLVVFLLFLGAPFTEIFNNNPFLLTFSIIFLIVLAAFWIWATIAQIGHTVRRLHDADFIGWWWWIGVIPYIGSILLPLLLFHPTVEKEVKWNTYLFEEKDKIK